MSATLEKRSSVMMILMRDKACAVRLTKAERAERLRSSSWSAVSSLPDERTRRRFVCDIVAPLLMRGLRCFKKVTNGIKRSCKFLSNVGSKEHLRAGSSLMYRAAACTAPSALFAIFIAGDSGRELPFKFV